MPTDKMLNRRLNVHYLLINAFFWGSYACFWPYAAAMLEKYGLTSAQSGLVTAGATVLSILLQTIVSTWGDRSAKTSSRRLIFALTCVVLLAQLLLRLFPGSKITVIAVLYMVIGVFQTSISPFLNAVAIEASYDGVTINYSFGRGIGSLCYAISVLTVGRMLDYLPPSGPEIISLLLMIVFLAVLFSFPNRIALPSDKTQKEEKASSVLRLLRDNPRFALLLLAAMFFLGAREGVGTYLVHVVERIGGSYTSMGTILALGAVAEFPGMCLFPLIHRRFSCETLLRFCSVFFVVRLVCYLFAPSIEFLYAVQILSMVEFSMFLPSYVYYVAEHIPLRDQKKGQALISSIPQGLGVALSRLAFGYLIDWSGVTVMLVTAVFSALLGVLILYHATRRQFASSEPAAKS